MNIYVGNLSHDCTDEGLREAFEAFGKVESATVIRDQYDNRSRGFGFVEMSQASEAQKAMTELNGKMFMGRELNVNEARPREQRGGGRGDNRRRGGGPSKRW